jgi:hypothetical protein
VEGIGKTALSPVSLFQSPGFLFCKAEKTRQLMIRKALSATTLKAEFQMSSGKEIFVPAKGIVSAIVKQTISVFSIPKKN